MAPPRTTLDIKLPALSGKPPVATTAPLSKAQLDKLATIEHEGFDLEVDTFPTRVAIRQRAKTRPKMSVNIHISHCTEVFKCRPATLEAWRPDEAALKVKMLRPELADRPDSVFELGMASIGGRPVVSIYQAGHFFGKDENGNPTGAHSHAYTMFYNDDHNVLHVTVSYTDGPTSSLQDMVKVLPRDFMQRVAVAFLDAYGQAWAER